MGNHRNSKWVFRSLPQVDTIGQSVIHWLARLSNVCTGQRCLVSGKATIGCKVHFEWNWIRSQQPFTTIIFLLLLLEQYKSVHLGEPACILSNFAGNAPKLCNNTHKQHQHHAKCCFRAKQSWLGSFHYFFSGWKTKGCNFSFDCWAGFRLIAAC